MLEINEDGTAEIGSTLIWMCTQNLLWKPAETGQRKESWDGQVTFVLRVLSSKAQLSMGTWSNKFKSFKCHIIFKNKNLIFTKEFRNPHVMVSSLVTQSKTLSRAAMTFCSSLCFYGAVPFSCCVLMLHKNKLDAW